MKAMGTDDQVFDNRYYEWTGNKARRSQRIRNKKSKRTIRRIVKQNIRNCNEF